MMTRRGTKNKGQKREKGIEREEDNDMKRKRKRKTIREKEDGR